MQEKDDKMKLKLSQLPKTVLIRIIYSVLGLIVDLLNLKIKRSLLLFQEVWIRVKTQA